MLISKNITHALKILTLMLIVFNVQAKSSTVTIYTSSSCSYCQQAKKYLDSKGIKYTVYEIDTSSKAKKKFKALHGKFVPLIFVGKQKVEGFDLKSLNKALKYQGLLKK